MHLAQQMNGTILHGVPDQLSPQFPSWASSELEEEFSYLLPLVDDTHRYTPKLNKPSNIAQPKAHSLTPTLLDLSPAKFKSATESPFLFQAGRGQISKATLSSWLARDRLYAQAYVAFIGALITRVQLPSKLQSKDEKQSSLPWRILRLLFSCLENIQRELDFFSDVAERYGLHLDMDDQDLAEITSIQPQTSDQPHAMNSATRSYIALFRSFAADQSLTLLDGLVVLWATELCYLTAWQYAKTHLDERTAGGDDDLDGGALRKEFIPNWTSQEFRDFVRGLAEVADLLAVQEQAQGRMDQEVLEGRWTQVLQIEEAFWPVVG